MAVLYQMYLRHKNDNGEFAISLPLLVNPTEISVKKKAQIAKTRTLAGTIFQPWPNMPDTIGFKGMLYGSRSLSDFNVLQRTIDNKPETKEVQIIYKWKKYNGYIENLFVHAAADKPRQFTYEFEFTSKEAFSLTRMMLGQLTGFQAEADFLKGQLYGLGQAGPVNALVAASMAAAGLSGLAFGSIIDPKTYTEIDKTLNAPGPGEPLSKNT